MKELINSYAEVLAEERELCRSLLAKAMTKKDVLVRGDIAALEEIVRVEEEMIHLAGRLEQRRLEYHRQLAQSLGLTEEELSVERLIVLARDAGCELETVLSDLKEILTELGQINEINAALIRQSLDFVNFSLSLFTGAEEGATYAGKENSTSRTARFVDRTV